MHYTLDYTETNVHELVRVDEYEKRMNNRDKLKVMSDDMKSDPVEQLINARALSRT